MKSLEQYTQREYGQAASHISSRIRHRPEVGVILGSGLGSLVALVERPDALPYAEIPHFPPCSVEGHEGCLVAGRLEGVPLLIMQGRTHYYEGYTMQHLALPVRVMKRLGVETLIVTNAAGGINPAYRTGELMLLTNHVNLVGMTGANPLRGPNDSSFGPRFPDLTCPYDPELSDIARRVACEENIPLHEGVYVMVAGPNYESAADVHFLKVIGADAVGMSTVPEVIVARHAGMRVLGVSGISNLVTDQPSPELRFSHGDVIEAGKATAPRLGALIRGVLKTLSQAPN